jgi:hypothetical protein
VRTSMKLMEQRKQRKRRRCTRSLRCCHDHWLTLPKAPKENDLLPANVAQNENIKALRDHWECNATTCHSEHCFVPAEGPHLRLTHEHLNKWSAAIVSGNICALDHFNDLLFQESGPDIATIDMPPRIPMFDAVDPRSLAAKSPLLQSRINQLNKDKTPAAPVINVVLPNDILGYGQYRVPAHNQGPPPAPPPAPPAMSSTLLLPNAKPGPKQDMATFCAAHNLSDAILEKFQIHKFTGTQAFRYIEERHLTEMGFMFREIVDLREAVEEWSGSA